MISIMKISESFSKKKKKSATISRQLLSSYCCFQIRFFLNLRIESKTSWTFADSDTCWLPIAHLLANVYIERVMIFNLMRRIVQVLLI